MGIWFQRSVIAVLLALGGCAQTPPLQVASRGQWPAGDKPTFGFGRFDSGEDAALRERIAACLGRRGMAASDSPAYLVQVGMSDRPARSDVFSGEQSPQPAGRKAKPAKRPIHSLAVGLTDMGNGQEAYRVTVIEPYRHPDARRPASDLADAACQAIEGKTAAMPAVH